MLNTIFFGTPAIAVPFLDRLQAISDVKGVVTSPDQPAGRGQEMRPTAVKAAGLTLSLPIYQPETLKIPEAVAQIKSYGADVGIVVAYGKLLPKDVLALPKHGFLNVHFSLLPKYRGAAPIQWALVNGESETGVTLFWLDEGMDTGPVFIQKKIRIQPEDDADTLRNKLVELGVSCVEEAVRRIEAGDIVRTPQTGDASKASLLTKDHGRIDWSKPAEAIWNQIRGLTPWPGTFLGPLKVLKAKPVFENKAAAPGTVIDVVAGEGPVVKCGQHSLALLTVQPEGKKPMPAWSWWQGARLKVGDLLR